MGQLTDHTKHIVDTISLVTVVGTLATWLPPIAALLSIVWTILRLYEMFSGKTMDERRKIRRKKNATSTIT